MKLKHFFIIFCFLLINKWANAQCVLTTTVKNGTTTIETTETYIYKRQAKQYNAIDLKVSTVQKLEAAKTFVKIKYTSTINLHQPKFLSIKFINGEVITLPLKFIANYKSDDKQQSIKSFESELDEGAVGKLNQLPVQSLGVLSATKISLAEIMVIESDMFQQLLKCLKNKQYIN